ncbi:MAG: HU family DNA-binding protein [Magnetococcales bacterium]|nr:HU family DNA-binding protein [Magnetococcales bacterium]
MNKSELTAKVATTTGMTSSQAEQAINAIVATVQETLASGGQVTLVGFGSFSVSERAARIGRNPRTGETIQIPASRFPNFKPGQTLKKAVAK